MKRGKEPMKLHAEKKSLREKQLGGSESLKEMHATAAAGTVAAGTVAATGDNASKVYAWGTVSVTVVADQER